MGKMSKEKGKRGEREVANILKSVGFEARRGQQNAGRAKGGEEAPDVYHTIPDTHLEVKFVEKLSIYKAMKQATEDAKEGESPVVVHRKSREEWHVTMTFSDYLKLVEKAIENTI